MFHLAIMWIIGAITAAAELFGTMIGLAEVWIKGAISTAVIFFVFAAPYLVVRKPSATTSVFGNPPYRAQIPRLGRFPIPHAPR